MGCTRLRLVSHARKLKPINPDTAKPYTDIKTAFGTACQLAGIENLHWHDLRHTFGTRLAEAGCSEATIADLMGHSDPQTTRRYTHATDRAKRAAVEAVRLKRLPQSCHKTRTATFAGSRKCLI